MTPSPDRIDVLDELSDRQQAQVRSVLEAALEADDVAPVSEHVVLRLPAGAGQHAGRHLLIGSSDRLRGYAYAEDAPIEPGSPEPGSHESGAPESEGAAGPGNQAEPAVRDVELVVHPEYRRAGRGRALLSRAAAQGPDGGVLVWSHGDHPGARALARALGYRVVRTLLQLRRPLLEPAQFESVSWPAGVNLRAFRPGSDDAEWLRLNARAFAHHPEQGRITQADLEVLMQQPWFDPKGFLIAERDGVMIGFHWTKVHPGELGEVYVLGVDPDLHGGGLGRALTLAGLRYLAAQGLRSVLLYVESDNEPALAVYRRLGFTLWSTDVMYAGGVLSG